jgi:hypothetical protein
LRVIIFQSPVDAWSNYETGPFPDDFAEPGKWFRGSVGIWHAKRGCSARTSSGPKGRLTALNGTLQIQ